MALHFELDLSDLLQFKSTLIISISISAQNVLLQQEANALVINH